MKRIKRTFTQKEKDLVYDLWKQGAGFSDIGRVIEAQHWFSVYHSLQNWRYQA